MPEVKPEFPFPIAQERSIRAELNTQKTHHKSADSVNQLYEAVESLDYIRFSCPQDYATTLFNEIKNTYSLLSRFKDLSCSMLHNFFNFYSK